MKAVHVTPSYCVESIKKHGIIRGIPLLRQYDKLMRRDYNDYDPKKGLVFTWALDTNVQRLFKDFVYWDAWGKPRNQEIEDYWYDWNKFNELMEIGPKAFSHIVPESKLYVALLIEIPDHPLYGDRYHHCQSSDMNPQWRDMDTRYEHNDKPLVLINYDVKPSAIKEIIGTANLDVKRNKRIDVNVNMKVRSLNEG